MAIKKWEKAWSLIFSVVLFVAFGWMPVSSETPTTTLTETISLTSSGSKTIIISNDSVDATVTCNWSCSFQTDFPYGTPSFTIKNSSGNTIVSRSTSGSGTFTANRGATYTMTLSLPSGPYGRMTGTGSVSYNYRIYGYANTISQSGVCATSPAWYLPTVNNKPSTSSVAAKTVPYPLTVSYSFSSNATGTPANFLIQSTVEKKTLASGNNNGMSGSFVLPANNAMKITLYSGAGGDYSPGNCNLVISYQYDDQAPNLAWASYNYDTDYSRKSYYSDGVVYTSHNPVTINISGGADIGSSGFKEFRVYRVFFDGSMVLDGTTTNSTYTISNGLCKVGVKSVDNAGNVSDFGPLNLILDAQAKSPVLNPVTYNDCDPVVSWQASDEGEGAGVWGYETLVKTEPTPPTDYQFTGGYPAYTFTSKTFNGLSAKNSYWFWIRMIDNVLNQSPWQSVIFSPLPATPTVTGVSTSMVSNGLPSYVVELKLSDVDADKYVIERQVLNNGATRVVLAEITYAEMQQNGFRYRDASNPVKHGLYTYFVSTRNKMGQGSSDTVYCNVMISNIAPQETVVGPKTYSTETTVHFTLGKAKDVENDALEYRLYTRSQGATGDGALKASWRPTVDNQQTAVTFDDKTSCEWQIRCIEVDAVIADRVETAQTSWTLLHVDTSYVYKLMGALCSDETWSGTNMMEGTVTVPASCKLIIAPGAKIMVKPGCELLIEGTIEAMDTGKNITFGPDGSGEWSGIRFTGTGGGTLNGMTIIGAERGIACTGTGTVNLLNCNLLLNDTGLHAYSGTITIDHCIFENNAEYGIKEDNSCNPLVKYCSFSNNGMNYYDITLLRITEEVLNSTGTNVGNSF